MKDVMIDIETLSTDSNALITTISCVQCDIRNGKIGESKEIGIELDQQLKNGAVLDKDTVIWWLSQNKDAIISMIEIEKIDVTVALSELNIWFIGLADKLGCKTKDLKLWGNGSSFDNTIVRNLYKRSNIEFVIPYYNDRDVRTLVDLYDIDTRKYEFKGIKHNGIDDCKHQINYCSTGYMFKLA